MSLSKNFIHILKEDVTSAKEDFEYEIENAKKILNDTKKIENLKYYNDYVDSLKRESNYIKQPCLFVGTGAIPFSIYILNKEFNMNRIDGLDIDQQAISIGKRILKKFKIDSKLILKSAEDYNNYDKYKTVVIALEVGLSHNDKKKIFKNIQNQQPNSTFIIRSSNTSDFINVEDYIDNYFNIQNKIKIFNGMSTSFICKTK